MTDALEKSLTRTAVETLEQLAFVFAFPETGIDSTRADSALAAAISFSGPFSGTLVMRVSSDVLQELAANMLGVEEEETRATEQQDALKEVLNVLCGNLLPVVAGKQAVFDLDPPEIFSEGSSMGRGCSAPACRVQLAVEEGRCDLTLFLDPPPAADDPAFTAKSQS